MQATPQRTVTVELGERSYPILIGSGLLARAGDEIKNRMPNSRVAIITDETVNAHHADALRKSLDIAGLQHDTIVVPAGEGSKSYEVLGRVVDELLALKLERGDVALALGGGVVGDLAGFAAAIMKRGMNFVQVPTTLLSQVDSSVGGKTGINSPHGKNLIGAFYQPKLVLADTDVLKTLSKREFAAGYAEVVKYGLIDKPEFFSWLEENREKVFGFGDELAEAIAVSCQAKADVVARDEQEGGVRALLNLGHTFGHALEGFCGYDAARLVHGEGVAIGMTLAHQFSNRLNHCKIEDVERVINHLSQAGLPTSIGDIPGEKPTVKALMDFIQQDKKVSKGSLTFILTNGIGKSYIAKDVPPSQVESFLNERLG